jgi:DNA modification methylase
MTAAAAPLLIRDRVRELRRVKASSLKPHPLNWRVHGKAQRAALAGVLLEIGYADALLARELEDGSLQLIDGHLRAESTPDLEVPVLVLDVNEKEAAKLLATLDPLAGMAGADRDQLEALLKDVGTDDAAVQRLLDATARDAGLETGGGPASQDDVPDAPAIAVTEPGDLWQLGPHRILCGDSTRPADVAWALAGELASMLWTDPPYGVEYEGGTGLRIQNDTAKALPELLRAAFAAASSVLVAGAPVYVAHPAGALSLVFGQAFVGAGWHLHETLVWVKDSLVLGHSDYHYRHEPILYGWKEGDSRPWHSGRSESSVFEVARPKVSPDHPTSKPVELVAAQIRNSSGPGALILDVFGGSGSTLIAAQQLGRRCVSIEIEPRYVDVIVKRLQVLTGHKAKNLTRSEAVIS